MNEPTVKLYRVEYHTTPSPGITYYKSYIEVWARDKEHAQERALLELNRTACFPASLIRITSTEKVD